MNDELRKIYEDCRRYGEITFRTDFTTVNGYLTFIDILYNGENYEFKMLNGEVLSMVKFWKELYYEKECNRKVF